MSIKKNRLPKLKRFFFIASYIPSRVFRGFEQLSSSIWQWVIACGKLPLRVTFEGAKFWSIYWFMSHNFRSQYARKSINGFKDADFDLVFN